MENDKMNKVSIDIVSELVNLLDRISRMRTDLFYDITAASIAQRVLETLVKVVSGPCFQNQKLLGHWRKLHRILNFYITQDLDQFTPVTEEKKVKIEMFCLSIFLVRAILKTRHDIKVSITKAMMGEINISELISKLVKIHQVQGFSKSKIPGFFGNNYEREIEPESKVFDAAFEIFFILVDLKLQHPFSNDLLNFNLNIELIFDVHEIVKPNYQSKATKKAKSAMEKVVKEKKKPFIEEMMAKSAKREIPLMIKSDAKSNHGVKRDSKVGLGLGLEEEEKKTSRTQNETVDDLDSEVSFIQTNKTKKKRKFRICCIPFKSTDGKCKRCFKFLF